jgi:hypothetical protein
MKLTEQQIAELAAIFDDVITSDSVAVQSAFQRLALLSSLAREDREEPGPFSMLLKRLDWAEHELKDLRRDLQIMQSSRDFSFAGENVIVDLGQNMNSSSAPFVYNTMSDTINISPVTLGAADLTWIGNLSPIDEITSITVK